MEIRKINLVAVALISSTIFWTSCSKDDDPEPSTEEVLDEMDNSDSTNNEVLSKNEISYKLDGVSVVLNERSFWGDLGSYYETSNLLNLNRGEGITSYDELDLIISDIDLDNLTLPATFVSNADVENVKFNYVQSSETSYRSDPFSTVIKPDFTIIIASISDDIAKGTFSGTVYDDDYNAYSLSDGSFELKFERK